MRVLGHQFRNNQAWAADIARAPRRSWMMAGRWAVAAVTTALAACVLATPTMAQDKPVTVLAAGSITVPLSGTADHFQPGLGGTAGLIWSLGEQYGVRVDGTWSTLRPKAVPAALSGQSLDVSARVQYATATFVFQAPPGRVRLYLLGGAGVYRRSVRVTGGDAGLVSVCVPWWFVCEPGRVPASAAAGTRSTTNIGVNVGLGVVVGRVFGEVRYHYASGPTFKTPQGDEPATGKFFPLTVGVRF